MAAPSKEELVILKVFRDAIKTEDVKLADHQATDMALLAWLRARDMSIPKSVEMLKKSLTWRKEEDIDNILSWKAPESYEREFPYNIPGRCKDGSPILVMDFGKWDIRKCVENGGRQTWLRWADKMLHECIDDMRKTNESRSNDETPVTQIAFIVNFEGYGFRQLASIMSVQVLMEVVARFESNYPERMKVGHVINASRAFTMLFSIVKSFMTMRTISKIEIFGSNAAKWKQALLKYISPDQLPESLGGTTLNGKINRISMELGTLSIVDKGKGQLITTEIAAGQHLKLDFEVKNGKSVLEWTFHSDSYDIGFSIAYNSRNEVLAYQKYNSHVTSQHGTLECEKFGTYTATFDNSYSKFRAKTVHYLISVTELQDVQIM